jgi:hypothetical protein
MIAQDYRIAYRNVASKLYQFIPEEIELAINDFDKILSECGYHMDGRMFFSILSDPTEEVMIAEIFLPIEENRFKRRPDDEVHFHSYFFVDHMVMTRITEDFNEQSQVKFWELIDYLKKHDMTQRTPVFVEYKSSHSGKIYVEMSVGAV